MLNGIIHKNITNMPWPEGIQNPGKNHIPIKSDKGFLQIFYDQLIKHGWVCLWPKDIVVEWGTDAFWAVMTYILAFDGMGSWDLYCPSFMLPLWPDQDNMTCMINTDFTHDR